KIGIVSPYAYPRPGGANAHIRETYERLRDLGHEVRIITAPWGDDPPAQDVIQIGQAIAVPFNGSIGRVTLSLRLEWLVSRMLDREKFDIIHHHEPFVPFLSFQILDSAKSPNVATFHAFRRFVHDQKVADVFFAGRVEDVDKARFYKTADIFVAPSTGQESFGIVLLEAMAAGCAVVASDIHGYKRVVQRNVSGLLVEPRDPDALAEALERLIVAPELRQSLGDAGARR